MTNEIFNLGPAFPCECGAQILYRIKHFQGVSGEDVFDLVCPACKKVNGIRLPSAPEVIGHTPPPSSEE